MNDPTSDPTPGAPPLDKYTAYGQPSAVIALARDAGQHGITTHDVAEATGWESSARSRTLSELVRDKVLVRLEEQRDGGAVHVLPEHVAGRRTKPYQSLASKYHAQGFNEGKVRGFTEGLEAAFMQVDNCDTLGDALILLRRMIAESR